MPTTAQVRARILEASGLGFIIPEDEIDEIGADYIESARFFSDTSWGTNQFRRISAVVFRPLADNAADRFRMAGDYDHQDQRLYIQGDSYTDVIQTDEHVEVWFYGLAPDTEVLPAIQRGQEYLGARIILPLTLVYNGGMFLGSTGWTATSSTLDTEDAVMQGRTSLEIANSGANGHATSTAFGVTPGAKLHAWALGMGDTGSNRIFYTDETNSVQVGDAQTFTARRPYIAYQEITVPDGCYEMSVSLGGVESGARTRWDMAFVNQENDGRLYLPAGIQEAWEFESLAYMRFHTRVEDDLYDALSVDVQEVPQSDYRVSDLSGDSLTPVVQMENRAWLRYPIVIQARLRDTTVSLLSEDTDITGQPLGMLAARATMELMQAWGQKVPSSQVIYQQALAELNRQAVRRSANGPAKRTVRSAYPWTS